MGAISDDSGTLKFVHTYGAGLHSGDARPEVHDPRWQQRQVADFVEFAALAEELGYDGITVTEHHAPLMTCPSPHLLLAAAAMRTSRIRLGTAVTVLPLYNPVRVAEEAGTLDLLSGGRFERLLNVDGTVATDGDGDGWPNSLSPMASRPTSWPPTTPTRWPARRGRRARRPAGGGRGAALSRRSGDERGDRMAPAPWS